MYIAAPLRELTCHIGSHSVTCHPAEVTLQPLPQPKLVLDLATPGGCKSELTWGEYRIVAVLQWLSALVSIVAVIRPNAGALLRRN